MMTEKNNTITITNGESETVCESCRVTAVTVSVVSAVITALLVAIISVDVHAHCCLPVFLFAKTHEVFFSGPGWFRSD